MSETISLIRESPVSTLLPARPIGVKRSEAPVVLICRGIRPPASVFRVPRQRRGVRQPGYRFGRPPGADQIPESIVPLSVLPSAPVLGSIRYRALFNDRFALG